MTRRAALMLALVLLPGVAGVEGARTPPAVHIVQPPPERAALGETTFAVEVQPAGGRRVVAVRLFVDGTLRATLTEPPYQVTFDAGPEPRPHTLRAEAEDDAGSVGAALGTTLFVSFIEKLEVRASPLPRLAILVNVVDRQGRPVLDIQPREFDLRVAGRSEPILEAALDRRPLAAGLLLDVSGSLLPYWDKVLRAADVFLASLQPEDGSEIIVFAGSSLRVALFGHDHVAHREAMGRLRLLPAQTEIILAGSRIYDALATGIESINSQPGQRTITLFTDAFDTGSRLGFEQVAEVVRGSGIRLDFIRFGRKPVGAYVESSRSIQQLRGLAEDSGGREWRVKEIEDIVPVFAALAREIGGRYRLVFAPDPAPRRPGRPRPLKLRVSRPRTRVLAPAFFMDAPAGPGGPARRD